MLSWVPGTVSVRGFCWALALSPSGRNLSLTIAPYAGAPTSSHGAPAAVALEPPRSGAIFGRVQSVEHSGCGAARAALSTAISAKHNAINIRCSSLLPTGAPCVSLGNRLAREGSL